MAIGVPPRGFATEQSPIVGRDTITNDDVLRGFIYPLHNLQGRFVSNGVSSAKKLADSVVNLSGQKVQRIGGFLTSENVGEQGIWA
jgi:hypothetical protein